MTDRYFSLEQLREAERLFASKRECSPAVNAIGRALLREYQLSLAESARLRAAHAALIQDIHKHTAAIDGYDGSMADHGDCLVCAALGEADGSGKRREADEHRT